LEAAIYSGIRLSKIAILTAIAGQKHFSLKIVLPRKTMKGVCFMVTPQLLVEHLLDHAKSIFFIIKDRA